MSDDNDTRKVDCGGLDRQSKLALISIDFLHAMRFDDETSRTKLQDDVFESGPYLTLKIFLDVE